MNGLGLGNRAEEPSDLGIAVSFSPAGKSEVFSIGLALAGKCGLEVFDGRRQGELLWPGLGLFSGAVGGRA